VTVLNLDELPPEAERPRLPAEFHRPVWDSSSSHPAWVCAVCWGDGWTSMWPCRSATVANVTVEWDERATAAGWPPEKEVPV
jgi:hypothetical protein